MLAEKPVRTNSTKATFNKTISEKTGTQEFDAHSEECNSVSKYLVKNSTEELLPQPQLAVNETNRAGENDMMNH